jgi:hypothetical protein
MATRLHCILHGNATCQHQSMSDELCHDLLAANVLETSTSASVLYWATNSTR